MGKKSGSKADEARAPRTDPAAAAQADLLAAGSLR